jgi:hypothetical protein
MSTLAARAAYDQLLNEIYKELPGGRFTPEQIRRAVEAAAHDNGSVPLRSAKKAAKKKQAVFAKASKSTRKPRLLHAQLTGAVAKKR